MAPIRQITGLSPLDPDADEPVAELRLILLEHPTVKPARYADLVSGPVRDVLRT